MPDEKTIEAAREDAREGKSPSTQAGEFVKEEMHHIREGKHGARNTKQAIAIGLSKARRAGVELPPPKEGSQSSRVRRKAEQDLRAGEAGGHKKSRARSRATSRALKREGHSAASKTNLSRQARSSERNLGSAGRHQAAEKAVRTKGKAGLRAAARKAARTRARERRAA
jgi:Family of unknown function (DUF6496)